MKIIGISFMACIVLLTSGCVQTTEALNIKGKETIYKSVDDASTKTQGVGIESQDIAGMVDKMIRDILSSPQIIHGNTIPRVIIDSKYFNNESSSRINKNIITEKLLVNLNRAANGKMYFLDRENIEMVVDERELKRDGKISNGSMGNVKKILGADYRLTGKIMSLDTLDNRNGEESRYHQITFKLIDLETGGLVWTNMYEFKKEAASNVVYR